MTTDTLYVIMNVPNGQIGQSSSQLGRLALGFSDVREPDVLNAQFGNSFAQFGQIEFAVDGKLDNVSAAVQCITTIFALAVIRSGTIASAQCITTISANAAVLTTISVATSWNDRLLVELPSAGIATLWNDYQVCAAEYVEPAYRGASVFNSALLARITVCELAADYPAYRSKYDPTHNQQNDLAGPVFTENEFLTLTDSQLTQPVLPAKLQFVEQGGVKRPKEFRGAYLPNSTIKHLGKKKRLQMGIK
jgi:hypothetical protein